MSDLSLIRTDPVTGVVSLAMGQTARAVTGIDLLVQLVALSFLRNPGRDVLDPDEGSGLRAAIGQHNISDSEELRLLVVQRTRSVEREILSRQTTSVTSPEERLSKLNVLDVASDETGGRVLIRVQVINEAGGSVDILV